MVGESNQNEFLIQIDASSFAKFEISEFEISRFDCIQKQKSRVNKLNQLPTIQQSDTDKPLSRPNRVTQPICYVQH